MSCMESYNKRVLFTTELRSYREAVAGTLQYLCPDAAIFEAEPGDLEMARLRPDVVVAAGSRAWSRG
ncbi:MAG: hypothetical protein M3338_00110 [Actinomycetota bacterium]|nr:hypothetical protein [Actinomycetota bacterium]